MKKLMSILLAIGLIGATTAVSAFAYDTDVLYSTSIDQPIDADGDGDEDGEINDETPFLLVVPDDLTVNGVSKKVYIAGIVNTPVTVTVPKTVTLKDTASNNLSANVTLGNGSLVLPVSLTAVGRSNADISAKWNTTPLSGEWSGNFVYSVS